MGIVAREDPAPGPSGMQGVRIWLVSTPAVLRFRPPVVVATAGIAGKADVDFSLDADLSGFFHL